MLLTRPGRAAVLRRYLLPELAGLRQRTPEIQIELATDDRQVNLVRDGFDIVIRGAMLADASVVLRRVGYAN